MPWFKVDDAFWSHPKCVAAPATALALWLRAGSWSAQQLTDGHVPAHVLSMLGGRKRDAVCLVSVGLWLESGTGWQFHDWSFYQPTRDQVQAERDANAERLRRWRARKRDTSIESDDTCNGVTNGVTNGVVTASVTVPPTRPDPTRPTKEETKTTSSSARKRATVIPDDFEPSPDLLEWARTEAPNAGRRDHDAFVDYWRGRAGAAARKADWPATWRNWMRKASDERDGKVNGARRSTTDERVAQAQSLLPLAQALDAAARPALASVPALSIEGRTA
jgi:hypothetical protein